MNDALASGALRDVAAADFLAGLRDMRPSTMDWLRRAKHDVTYANQDGFYNTLAQSLEAMHIR